MAAPQPRPNPSLESGPPSASHLAREAPAVYAAPRGPGVLPLVSAQLKRQASHATMAQHTPLDMNSQPLQSLERFVQAQEHDYANALRELKQGRKQTHWIWYVLPQLRGLGQSALSHEYGIAGRHEARQYLEHPVLGARLRECVAEILNHRSLRIEEILGDIDALKFRSCLTLFAEVAPEEPVFAEGLAAFYGGAADTRTLDLLAGTAR